MIVMVKVVLEEMTHDGDGDGNGGGGSGGFRGGDR